MLVVNDDPLSETFENLIIEVKPEITNAYLVEYTPSKEIEYNAEHEEYAFEGELTSRVQIGLDPDTGLPVGLQIGESSGSLPVGGGGGGTTTGCVSVLLCNRDLYGGIGEIHYAGERCKVTYSSIECNWSTTGTGSSTSTGYNNYGSGTTTTNTTTTTPVITSPVVPPPPTPCEQLSGLNNPAKANIKPAIQNLKNTLSQPGENGMVFEKPTSSTYNTKVQPATTTRSVPLIAGPNIIASAHTHPGTAYPMFSWTDVYNLYETYRRSAFKDEVTYILVCRDEFTFEEHAYAIKVKDFRGFTAKLNATLGVENYLTTITLEDKQYDLDNNILGIEYEQDNNYERAFLRFFSDYNIDIYKADADLNNWNKLILDPITLTVNQTPCAQN